MGPSNAQVEAFQAKYREISERCNWGHSWPSDEAVSELLAAALQPDRMTVINPDEWEPCSPEYLSAGGSCHAPRVWNENDKNHWHPKLSLQPDRAGSGDAVRVFANRLFNLEGFMLLETYKGKPAVTVTFPDQKQANHFHSALVDLSRHRVDRIGAKQEGN
ncbi:hypothetical protein [Rhizobium leucaenae]|uniref:hypothetical protein n=1 Tax=Rhizobium leucaenae TaxID=29450 RepID=UPI0007EE2D8C|nr:hypothetical protein [Rhizobium leucaenae]